MSRRTGTMEWGSFFFCLFALACCYGYLLRDMGVLPR